jgi:hypothetical protein
MSAEDGSGIEIICLEAMLADLTLMKRTFLR